MSAGDWGARWRHVLAGSPEAAADPGDDLARRVRQGVATYRSGRVSDVRIGIGRVTARVQGSRATPFLVELELPVLDDAGWDVVLDLLASRVRYSARLLAGQHPEGLEDEAAEVGVRLFPSLAEVQVAAGHSGEDPFPVAGAAVWEAVAVRLDASPFPLLQLRGRGRERVLRDVGRRRRSGRTAGAGGIGVDEVAVVGWALPRAPLDAVAIPPARPPRMAVPALRVLGEPDGWAGALSPVDLLGPLVVAGADAAAALLEGRDPQEP